MDAPSASALPFTSTHSQLPGPRLIGIKEFKTGAIFVMEMPVFVQLVGVSTMPVAEYPRAG